MRLQYDPMHATTCMYDPMHAATCIHDPMHAATCMYDPMHAATCIHALSSVVAHIHLESYVRRGGGRDMLPSHAHSLCLPYDLSYHVHHSRSQ